ncbi:MAG: hypothetical protein P1Q69_11985, partial [Candidatus Thorarchaeota archaeon]|nr:hypothetical protein [Candidatus Thorarchaeota archaeon]
MTRLGNRKMTTIIALVVLVGNPIPSTIFYMSGLSSLASHFQTGVSGTEAPSQRFGNDFAMSDESFGDQQLLWVPYPSGEEQELATLLSVGTHCYVYMENSCIVTQGESNAIAKCDELRDVFDNTIYPKGVELAGNFDGNLGDIDGDPKVTMFLGPFREKSGQVINGYYVPRNELEVPFSNYREMFYIDATNTVYDAIFEVLVVLSARVIAFIITPVAVLATSRTYLILSS